MYLSNPSKLLLHYKNIFFNKRVFFSGNIQDSLPEVLQTKKSYIHIQKFHLLKNFKKIHKKNIFFSFLVKKKMIKNCNNVIYFFPKNKKEAYFQIKNITSLLKKKCKIFIIGENRSGIKSFINFFKKEINFKKFSYGKKCVIYFKKINHKFKFYLNDFYKVNYWNQYPIKFLPGVFGYKKIDLGSELLISTFYKNQFFNKKILDICAGSGILSIAILSMMKKNKITASDNCLIALKCCQKNFLLNNLRCSLKISDIYSNIKKKFHIIISNPPTHNNLKKTSFFIKKIISKAKFFLKKKGELRIVVNNSIRCNKYFKKSFKIYKILSKNKKFTVYQGLK